MTGQSTTRSITPATGATANGAAPGRSPMALFHGTRPLKRWRYVAVFCEQLMACAAQVQVGPGKQVFWALLPRPGGPLPAP